MKTLREKAKGINKFTKDGELLASYLHEDVKEALLQFYQLLEEEHEYCYLKIRFNEIIGDFEK